MNVQELIKKYDITLYGEDKIRIGSAYLLKKGGSKAANEIKERKSEIIDFLKAEEDEKKRAYEERQSKIRAIDGLEEIQNAIEEQIKWRRAFETAMSRGDGILPSKPEDNISELKQKYPRAAAYLTAESESLKSNSELSAIGRRALEAIISGDPHEEVLRKMEEEQKEFTDRHIWD
ncbi:MAG: hypothetical protein K2I96_00045 [Lachnospiraceae bacterium]|nr:hypothetical protein [Lachnospiraceae bacterium]